MRHDKTNFRILHLSQASHLKIRIVIGSIIDDMHKNIKQII